MADPFDLLNNPTEDGLQAAIEFAERSRQLGAQSARVPDASHAVSPPATPSIVPSFAENFAEEAFQPLSSPDAISAEQRQAALSGATFATQQRQQQAQADRRTRSLRRDASAANKRVQEARGRFAESFETEKGAIQSRVQSLVDTQEAMRQATAEQAQAREDHQAELAGLNERATQEQQRYIADRDKLVQDVRDAKIEPDRLFKTKGTVAKIGAAIATALGQYASIVGGGRNVAAEIIDRAIDRDVAAQQTNLANKRGGIRDLDDAFKAAMGITRDSRQAALTAFQIKNEAAMGMLREAQGLAQIDDQRLVLEGMLQDRERKQQAALAEAAGIEQQNAQRQISSVVRAQQAQQQQAGEVEIDPGQLVPGTDVANSAVARTNLGDKQTKRKIQDLVAASLGALRDSDRLIRIREEFGGPEGEFLNREVVAESKQARVNIRNAIRVLKNFGTPQHAELLLLEDEIPDATTPDPTGLIKAKLKFLRRAILEDAQKGLATKGLTLSGQSDASNLTLTPQ